MDQDNHNVPDSVQEPIEKRIRTQTDVDATYNDIVKSQMSPTYIWLAIIASFTLLAAFARVWAVIPLAVFLMSFIVLKARAHIKVEQDANAMTLGVSIARGNWLTADTGVAGMVRSISEKLGAPAAPDIRYFGNSFTGQYDPNTSTITLGKYLADFETDASYATALHETCHHALITGEDGHRHKTKLQVAGIAQMASFAFGLLYIFCVLAGSETADLSRVFSLFMACMVISKACITTHEYDTNAYVRQILFDDDPLPEIEPIKDKATAFAMLKDGERTYTVDLIGWLLATFFLCGLVPML